MPAAYVQSATGFSNFGSSFTVAYGSNNAAGNLLVYGLNTSGVTSVSDSLNTPVDSGLNPVNGGANLELWYVANCAAGANTLTVNVGGFGGVGIAAEYSGIETASPLDKTQSGTGFGTAASSGATAATAQADELLIGLAGAESSRTFTAGGSFTERQDLMSGSASNPMSFNDRIVSAAAAYTFSATLNSAGNWAACIATFKAAAGGITAEPPVGVVTITGVLPAVGHTATPPIGVAAQAGVVPAAGHSAEPPTGAVALAGVLPAASHSVEPPIGGVVQAGVAPAVGHAAEPSIGVIVVQGVAPSTSSEIIVEAPIGEVSVTGIAPVPLKSAAVDPGQVTLTGVVPGTSKVFDISSDTVVSVAVVADADDGQYRQFSIGGTRNQWRPTGQLFCAIGDALTGIYFGNWSRFVVPGLASGQPIVSASITFTVDEAALATSLTLLVDCYAEDADDSTAPTSTADLQSRTLTTASNTNSVAVPVPAGATVTLDVTHAVRAVLSRPGFSAGNAISIVTETAPGSDSSASLRTALYESTPFAPPVLTIITSHVPQVMQVGIVPAALHSPEPPAGVVVQSGLAPNATKSAEPPIGTVVLVGIVPDVPTGKQDFPSAVTIERVGFIVSYEQLGFACTVVRAGFGGVTLERRST